MTLFLTEGELDSTRGRDALAVPEDSLSAVGAKGRQPDSRDSTDPFSPAFQAHRTFRTQQGTSCAPCRTIPRMERSSLQLGCPRCPSHSCSMCGRAGTARGARQSQARPTPCPGTTIACRSLSATWEAAGGHPAGRGSSQLQALPALGRASKTPKSPAWHPKPSSP